MQKERLNELITIVYDIGMAAYIKTLYIAGQYNRIRNVVSRTKEEQEEALYVMEKRGVSEIPRIPFIIKINACNELEDYFINKIETTIK